MVLSGPYHDAQVQLAEALGISQPQLAFYEVGKRRVPVSLLPGLARALDVSIEALIADDDAAHIAAATPRHGAPGAARCPGSNSSSTPSPVCPRPSRSSFPRCSTACWRNMPAQDRRPRPPDPLSRSPAVQRRSRDGPHAAPDGGACQQLYTRINGRERVTAYHTQPIVIARFPRRQKAVPQRNTRAITDKPLLSLNNVMHARA